MPQVDVDGLTLNYEVQGEGEPLLLIPYLSADHACYAFQLPAYTEHFSCIALDLPGTGESDKPAGPYSTETYADQVAGFLGAIGVEQAHVAGVSLGAAAGRLPRPERGGHGARRERGSGRDRRPDADHGRGARPRLLAALRQADQRQDRRKRAGRLRPPVARRAARGPRDLQPRHARLPAAPALLTGGRVREQTHTRLPNA